MPAQTDAGNRDGSAARKLTRLRTRYRGARRRSPPPGSFCPHPSQAVWSAFRRSAISN